MVWRWLKWVALGLTLVAASLIFGVAPYWLAGIATVRRYEFPDRQNAGLTPASLGLPYEEVSFAASDGVRLSGWWVPSASGRGTVVLVHGLNRSRIEMVRKGPFLNRRGWNVLLFDLRHHGKSGGDRSTFGFLERQDVLAAKAYALSRARGPVVLWGVSLGAAAATLAAGEDGQVAALVCDSTYRSLRDTVRHHLALARNFRWWLRLVPPWPVAGEVVYWIGRRGGFDPDQVDVMAAAARLAGRPVLFVANSGDKRMPPEIARELTKTAGDRARLLVVTGNRHGHAWSDGQVAYQAAVETLLDEVATAPGSARLAALGSGGTEGGSER